MKRLVLSLVLAASTFAAADPQIPDKLVGVWSTDDSVLKGNNLVSGQALYIDVDGTGAMASAANGNVSYTRLAVTAYNANNQHIEADLDSGTATRHITLNYEPAEAAITTPDTPSSVYHRRKEVLSPAVRKLFNLDDRVNSVPPPPGTVLPLPPSDEKLP